MAKKCVKTRTRIASSDPESPIAFRTSQSHANDDSRVVTVNRSHREASHHRDSSTKTHSTFDSTDDSFVLHASDSPGLSLVSQKLDGHNYNSWCVAMHMALVYKDKWSFIDGTLPRSDESDSLFKLWNRCNTMAKSWILNVVDQEIYDSILYFDDAFEIWIDLKKRFHISNPPRKYQLEQEILAFRQGSLSLPTYYTKMKTLWQRLANTRTQKICKCNCGKVEELLDDAETSRIIQFLMGLNDSYANTRGQIINKKNRPSLSDIYNMLDQDHGQCTIGSTTKGFVTPSAFQVTGTNSESSLDVTSGVNTVNLQQRPRHVCTHCGVVGHLKDRCYKLHGYPPNWTGKKKNTPTPIQSQTVSTIPTPIKTILSTNVTLLQDIDSALLK